MSEERTETDFDHHSAEYAADPWAANIAMNTHCPVSYSRKHGGFWLVSGFEQVSRVAHQPELFSSAHELPNVPGRPQGTVVPASSFRGLPLEIDPPEYTEWRKALNTFFSPPAARRLRPRIQQYATWCVDKFIESGEIDLVLDLSNPVPALITLELVGLPMDDWRVYADVLHALVYTHPGTPEFDRVEADFARLIEEVRALVPKRRAHPGDDFISFLTQVEIGGEALRRGRRRSLQRRHPRRGRHHDRPARLNPRLPRPQPGRPEDARRLARADPRGVRRVPAVLHPGHGRRTHRDGGHHGGRLPDSQGRTRAAVVGAANLDAKVFPQPEVIDLDRDAGRQAAFGVGIHRCIGRHIARMDFEVVIGEVLARMPDYQIITGEAEKYPTVGQIHGYLRMPVRFTPGERIGSESASNPLPAALSE